MAVFVNYYLLTQLKTQLHLETALFNHENMIDMVKMFLQFKVSIIELKEV